MLRVRLVSSAGLVAGLSAGRTYEVLDLRARRTWMRQTVLLTDDTGKQVWHPRSLLVPEFSLWLEFELWPDTWDPENDFANVEVKISDGRRYAINVWSYGFLAQSREQDARTGECLGGQYTVPPDLFLSRLTRSDVERTIEDLLQTRSWELPEAWRCEPDDEVDP